MKLQDAYRAQYFFLALEKQKKRVVSYISSLGCFSMPKESIFDSLCTQLSHELDQLLLPCVVSELHRAKKLNLLRGASSDERYRSFFIDSDGFTENARKIPDNFPYLFVLIDQIINDTFDSLIVCINRYCQDMDALVAGLSLATSMINSIKLLEGADRHRSHSSFLITLSDGFKIIYKPVDLGPDILFQNFITKLGLGEDLLPKFPDVLSKNGYGWIKYVYQSSCQTKSEIHDFYRRAGVLLAVSEALNYTDGHCENLIANGAYPVLIDCETLFQNYEPVVSRNKNILSTLLIQKITSEKDQYLISALQAPSGKKVECLQPYPVKDHTDEIQIHYFGVSNARLHHHPDLHGSPCNACDYVSDVIEGFSNGYVHISSKIDEILDDFHWWDRLSSVRSRVVLRETISYVYLLRKILQPEFISTKDNAKRYLVEKLGDALFAEYEIEEILRCNIPYFYQLPGQKHIYDGNGNQYTDVFSESAVDRLKVQFTERSKDKMLFNCEILSRHLIPYEVHEGAAG